MTPADFTAALSDHLRHRGVAFRRTDLEAFTADAGQRLADAPDVDAWAERFIESRRPTAQVGWGWKRFRRVFAAWFAVLMLFFALANLVGLVRLRGMNLWPSAAGFPLTYAEWEFNGFHFFGVRLIFNVLIAVAVSAVVAAVLAALRCRVVPVRLPRDRG